MMGIAYITLILGAMGEAGFYGCFITPHIAKWLGVILAMVPLLVIYTLTFFNMMPLPPRPFRLVVIIAMCWLAISIAIAEFMAYFGKMQTDSPQHAVVLCRCLMHVGWVALIPMGRLCRLAKRAEAMFDVTNKDEPQH